MELAEVKLEELALHWGSGNNKVDPETFNWHAWDEAQFQIWAKDLETELDAADGSPYQKKCRGLPAKFARAKDRR